GLDPVRDDFVELSLRGYERDARTQARDHSITATAALLHFALRERDRFPNIDTVRKHVALQTEDRNRKLEVRRHNSDHGVTAAVQEQRFSDKHWIGIETPFPESLADHDDVVVTNPFLFAGERSSFDRLNSEQWKQRRSHHRAGNSFRNVSAAEVECGIVERREVGAALEFLLEIEELGRRTRDAIESHGRELFPD